jgi:hypothetical protein
VTSDWLLCALYCSLLALAGWPWAALSTGRRPTPVGRAGLAYLIGAALVTLGLLLVAFVDISITRPALVIVMAVVWALGTALERLRRPLPASQAPVRGSWRPALPALAVAVAGLGYLLLRVLLAGAVPGSDYISFWGRKGLAVFFEHNLDFALLRMNHTSYPLEISNLYGGLYLFLGHVNDQVIGLPLVMFAVSLAGATWWMCRLVMPPAVAAAAVALPITAPQLAASAVNGSADAAVAAYVTVCVLACFLWVRDDDAGWAGLAGLAAGGAAWCKLEGALTAGVLLVTVVLLRRRIRASGTVTSLAWLAVFTVPWLVFQRIHGIRSDPNQFRHTNLNLPWIVVHVSDRLLLQTGAWGVFWVVCLAVVALAAPLWWRTPWRTLAALTLPNLVLTMGAYVVTYSVSSQAIEVTAHRLYLHLAPSVAVMTAASAAVSWTAFRDRQAVPLSAAADGPSGSAPPVSG